MTQKVALCTCGGLLIYTLYFRDQPWLCMNCGQIYQGAPRMQDSTPEAEAKWRALEADFMSNCGSKLIVTGLYREGCAICDLDDEKHMFHASPQEWQECNDALYWLSERTGRTFHLVNGVITPQ
jgi:hypothetical protein